jgi:hypothetical protein
MQVRCLLTLAWISGYFAWRRGNGRPKNQKCGNWAVLCVLVSIWICAFLIQSISLLEVFGQYGYDAFDGMCYIIECEICSKNTNICLPTGAPIAILGIGLPFIIMVISYSLVYKNLSKITSDLEKWNQRRAVLILAFPYFIANPRRG